VESKHNSQAKFIVVRTVPSSSLFYTKPTSNWNRFLTNGLVFRTRTRRQYDGHLFIGNIL